MFYKRVSSGSGRGVMKSTPSLPSASPPNGNIIKPGRSKICIVQIKTDVILFGLLAGGRVILILMNYCVGWSCRSTSVCARARAGACVRARVRSPHRYSGNWHEVIKIPSEAWQRNTQRAARIPRILESVRKTLPLSKSWACRLPEAPGISKTKTVISIQLLVVVQ